MTEVRNLLLIGRTGGGKSTLGNVLTNGEFFKESFNSVSETKNLQNETFEWEGKKYCVFDTVGAGDTKLSKGVILYRIAEGINAMKGGINQVLFVVGGRFTKEEIEAFEMFHSILETSRIFYFTTLVRSKFNRFRSPGHCREDRELLFKENEEMVYRFKRIIYVDNPPIDTDDDVEKAISLKKREESRKILMNYLRDECQATFKLKCWDILSIKFSSYIGRRLEFEEKKEKKEVISKGKKDNYSKSLESELENAKDEFIQEIGSCLETEVPEIKIVTRRSSKSTCLLI